MTDTAQLREAIDRLPDIGDGTATGNGYPVLHDTIRDFDPEWTGLMSDWPRIKTAAQWAVAFIEAGGADAARELLALKEAGALIIEPDESERMGWPMWAVRALAEALRDRLPLIFILDALRDAKPDSQEATK